MDFLQRNLFAQLRTDNFGTKEELEPMTVFKKKKIAQMMKNLNAVPAGAVLMNNSFLNRRLIKIQKEERHSIDTSIETLYLLRLLVSNINGILANGISIRGIIQLGQYLRTRGDKVDFIKLESWLRKLHIQRMAQLEGSVLITFFDFEKDEIPFVRRVEKGAYKLTLRSLYYNTRQKTSSSNRLPLALYVQQEAPCARASDEACATWLMPPLRPSATLPTRYSTRFLKSKSKIYLKNHALRWQIACFLVTLQL